jgi:hypothetical protein
MVVVVEKEENMEEISQLMHIGTNNQDNSFHNELDSQKLTFPKGLPQDII